MRKRLSEVINDVLGGPDEPLIERMSAGPPCPECGERSDPSEIEKELVGSGLEAYRCPKCGELI